MQGAYPSLAGGIFRIETASGEKIAVCETDENGNFAVEGLRDGVYIARQLLPARGYKPDTEPKTFSIRSGAGGNIQYRAELIGDNLVEYVPKEELGAAFGRAHGVGTGHYAQVRNDLSPRVQRFVKAHELYHLQDKKGGGALRQELRANFYPALKDPIGLAATAYATLKDPERRALYKDRLKNKY